MSVEKFNVVLVQNPTVNHLFFFASFFGRLLCGNGFFRRGPSVVPVGM